MLDIGPSHRELGHLAVWTVSSAKSGNGIAELRDNSTETYWQSDGHLPHYINIEFQRKVTISEVSILLNYKLDESYTPQKLLIRAGNKHADLKEVAPEALFKEPVGWKRIKLRPSKTGTEDDGPLRAYLLQVVVLENHQNGRDSHIRQIDVFGPRTSTTLATDALDHLSPELETYSTVR